MTHARQARQALCVFYFVVAVVALFGTWGQNLSYFPAGSAGGILAFLEDLALTPASRSISIDIVLFFLSAAVWMVYEARRLKMRWVSLYILFGLIIAISVTFPLFLIARERALGDSV